MLPTGEIIAVNTKMLYVIGPLQVQITVLTANSPVKSHAALSHSLCSPSSPAICIIYADDIHRAQKR